MTWTRRLNGSARGPHLNRTLNISRIFHDLPSARSENASYQYTYEMSSGSANKPRRARWHAELCKAAFPPWKGCAKPRFSARPRWRPETGGHVPVAGAARRPGSVLNRPIADCGRCARPLGIADWGKTSTEGNEGKSVGETPTVSPPQRLGLQHVNEFLDTPIYIWYRSSSGANSERGARKPKLECG
jgi:hypothetical protein